MPAVQFFDHAWWQTNEGDVAHVELDYDIGFVIARVFQPVGKAVSVFKRPANRPTKWSICIRGTLPVQAIGTLYDLLDLSLNYSNPVNFSFEGNNNLTVSEIIYENSSAVMSAFDVLRNTRANMGFEVLTLLIVHGAIPIVLMIWISDF